MTAVPERIHGTVQAIYRLHEVRAQTAPRRTYLGGSEIGHECARHLWYKFRLAGGAPIPGRILRLFDSGHREEIRLLNELREVGLTIWDRQPDGQQFGVQACGGHLRGHLDAVAVGLPEAPKTPHLIDVKTIKNDLFEKLLKDGFRKCYPKYFAQGVVYCGLAGLTRAAFFFVNKDDDRIHIERFDFDPVLFAQLLARADRIVFAAEPLPRLSEKADFWQCKLCSHHGICHLTDAPEVNCRTCAHVTPVPDGTWRCEHYARQLSIDEQRVGCNDHRYIPALLQNFADLEDGADGNPVYTNRLTGRTFVNGTPGYASVEIRAVEDKRMLGNAGVDELKDLFGAKVIA